MKIIITGRHMDITKPFNQYVKKRLQKWSSFLGSDAVVHVVASVEGYRQQVEVTAKDGPYEITAKQTTKDLYQSVDLLAEKVGRQIKRKHERLRRGKNLRRRRVLPEEFMAAPAPEAPVAKKPRIVVAPVAGKPMTQEEAALQLATLRNPFLVFEDAETGQLAVMTKNPDGSFKLITKD
ncbi:MAG: ribosome-associated translation inhibitor RaiA [candidate division FCPU426 bacterium]